MSTAVHPEPWARQPTESSEAFEAFVSYRDMGVKRYIRSFITPGEVLNEEFLLPMGMCANQLARDLDVPANHIAEIIDGQREITADTALRLARYFNMEVQFWLDLQANYDSRLARRLKLSEALS